MLQQAFKSIKKVQSTGRSMKNGYLNNSIVDVCYGVISLVTQFYRNSVKLCYTTHINVDYDRT